MDESIKAIRQRAKQIAQERGFNPGGCDAVEDLTEERQLHFLVRRQLDNFNSQTWRQIKADVKKWRPPDERSMELHPYSPGPCTSLSPGAWAGKLEVKDMWNGQYVVDFVNHSCSCRRRHLNGIPCIHARSAIMSAKREPEEYVDAYYSVERHSKAYGFVVNPINGPRNSQDAPQDENTQNAPQAVVATPQPSVEPTPQHSAQTYKKKRKCTVCLQGHNRKKKCPAPAAKMWKNYDKHNFNCERGAPSRDNIGASSQSASQAAPTQVVPPSSTQLESEIASANISGVSVKASFIKKE
ncbi:hypothetical protein BUALT_Bualt06G0094500 [Buddleja alternifolia]|uniref:SWIM-type domain-containing protein n=1 Tax=Buddleja alternifolia TaxID=168488 RepID=A0AAV6XIA0_9LAMI|nr:hypothetical protein BUALT_Bualt06G0094500 [Buddleja alternifolia]